MKSGISQLNFGSISSNLLMYQIVADLIWPGVLTAIIHLGIMIISAI